MSALAGTWRFDDKPDLPPIARACWRRSKSMGRMTAGSGPTGPLAMGRRLFRTLPEDVHDRQPLQSRDGRLKLVADVRLDNRDELMQ